MSTTLNYTIFEAPKRGGKSTWGAEKLSQLVLNTAPHDDLLPSWVITNELCLGRNAWEYLEAHLAPYVESIRWRHRKKGLPRAVTLKPHANGNRHLVEFKSLRQQLNPPKNLFAVWGDDLYLPSILEGPARFCTVTP